MEKIEWKPEYETNIELIDEQHRNILKILNKLIKCYAPLPSSCDIDSTAVIDEMDNYITLHFQLEEYYASRYNFPKVGELISEHNMFRNLYSTLRYYYLNPELKTVSSEVMVKYLNILLVEWFKAHLSGIDKEFAVFIKNQNVKVV